MGNQTCKGQKTVHKSRKLDVMYTCNKLRELTEIMPPA